MRNEVNDQWKMHSLRTQSRVVSLDPPPPVHVWLLAEAPRPHSPFHSSMTNPRMTLASWLGESSRHWSFPLSLSPLRLLYFFNPLLIYIKIWASTGLLCVDGGPASPYSAKRRRSRKREELPLTDCSPCAEMGLHHHPRQAARTPFS